MSMQEATEATPVERARAAAATGDWQDAYELLFEVDAKIRSRDPTSLFWLGLRTRQVISM